MLVEFSVSFRVIVVEQMLDAHSSQPLSTFTDGEGRRYRDGLRQRKRDTTAHRRPYQQDRQHLKKSQ